MIKTHGHVSAAKKDTRHTVCYLQEAESSWFQPLVSLEPLNGVLSNLHILCSTYTWPYTSNLKEIGVVVNKIYTSKNCPIFFTFSSPSSSSLHHLWRIFEPHKNNFPVVQFLSNLVHLRYHSRLSWHSCVATRMCSCILSSDSVRTCMWHES